jgi:hypothetical protein
MVQKLKEHSWLITMCLLLLLSFKQCGVASTLKRTNKRLEYLSQEISQLRDTVATKEDLEIEGLKAEKRMIQSTDRRMMDVQRQSKIDSVIKILENR